MLCLISLVRGYSYLVSACYIKVVGTLNFSHIAMRLDHMESNQTVTIISLIFLVAFSSKAALVIFMWLPKAYAVLNTELAALFAALMTKVGRTR